MICRLVISFFKLFLLVLSFKVDISLLISLTATPSVYYQFSFFFSIVSSPCFFFISKIFIAFCYSISIIALLSWILSLKFSKICSLILFIYSFSSMWPQTHTPELLGAPFWGGRGGLAILLSIRGSFSRLSIDYSPLSYSRSFNY